MIKIQTANHELPSVTTYPICIFSLLLLPLHSPLSASALHALVLANRNAPAVPQVSRFNMLNAFNISFLHIILQQFSTHHCKVPMCLKATFNTSITLGLSNNIALLLKKCRRKVICKYARLLFCEAIT